MISFGQPFRNCLVTRLLDRLVVISESYKLPLIDEAQSAKVTDPIEADSSDRSTQLVLVVGDVTNIGARECTGNSIGDVML